jgi:hypothetical protein
MILSFSLGLSLYETFPRLSTVSVLPVACLVLHLQPIDHGCQLTEDLVGSPVIL